VKFYSYVMLLLISTTSYGVPPVLSDIVVADVTDRSFSLIWTTDQAGTPFIEVYSDELATSSVNNTKVVLYPVSTGITEEQVQESNANKTQLINAAKSSGIIKVSVSGLTADTQYFLKYAIQSSELSQTTLCPDAGAQFCPETASNLLRVKTALAHSKVSTQSNSLYVNDLVLLTDQTISKGEVILVAVENSPYPVSYFADDNAPLPFVILDLNNLYARKTRQSLQLQGAVEIASGFKGEAFVIRRYRGQAGNTSQLYFLKQARGVGEIVDLSPRTLGDCNADERVDGLDALMLGHAVAGTFTQQDYAAVAFHPVLCNLFSEQGRDNVMPVLSVDVADKRRLDSLLIGTVQVSDLPDAP